VHQLHEHFSALFVKRRSRASILQLEPQKISRGYAGIAQSIGGKADVPSVMIQAAGRPLRVILHHEIIRELPVARCVVIGDMTMRFAASAVQRGL